MQWGASSDDTLDSDDDLGDGTHAEVTPLAPLARHDPARHKPRS